MDGEPSPECLDLDLGGLVLERDIHFQAAPDGIQILKSGHQRIHNHLLRSADPESTAAGILDRVLHDPRFSESTFDQKFRPASIFRGMSRRPLVPQSHVASLCRHLDGTDVMLAQRSAMILPNLFKAAADYPDLRTLLHCYFRTNQFAPALFTTFIRARLRPVKSKRALDREWTALHDELDRFRRDVEPRLATMPSVRTESEEAFAEALADLSMRLRGQRTHRLEEL